MQVTTILNPAPWSIDVATLLPYVDIVTPNETEASAMSGMVINDISDAMKAAKHIHNAGQCSVIITMGKQGALIYDGQQCAHIPAFSAVAVDTTGAGMRLMARSPPHWRRVNHLLKQPGMPALSLRWQ